DLADFSRRDWPGDRIDRAQRARRRAIVPTAQERAYRPDEPDLDVDFESWIAKLLHDYADKNRAKLGLRPGTRIAVRGFHPTVRIGRQGQLVLEVVTQFTQKEQGDAEARGGVPIRGGVTLVASADGHVRHIIAKPLPMPGVAKEFAAMAARRQDREAAFIEQCDRADPFL